MFVVYHIFNLATYSIPYILCVYVYMYIYSYMNRLYIDTY